MLNDNVGDIAAPLGTGKRKARKRKRRGVSLEEYRRKKANRTL